MPAKKEISLLPDQENANSPINRVIKWLTTVGRVVIIITEFVVIGAFLSRFWLDRINSDLSEKIRQQKAILESTQEFEKEYNLLQQRLSIIDEFYKKDIEIDSKIVSLVSSLPPTITLSDISFNTLSTNVTTNLVTVAFDEQTIIDYLTNLIVNPDIQSVTVKRIEKKTRDNKYFIDIIVNFKSSTQKS